MRLGLGLGINRRAGKGDAPTDFRILVNTANTGVSNNDQFQFTNAAGNFDVEIWDSTGTTLQETITGLTGAATITIAAGAGTYELRVYADEVGGLNRIRFANSGDKNKLIEIRNWGSVNWASFGQAFWGCANLNSVTSLSGPPITNTIDYAFMFFNCTSIRTLDLSTWDVSAGQQFDYMFAACTSLVSVDISGWNTSNALDMNRMFTSNTNIESIIGLENLVIGNVLDFTAFLNGVTLPTSQYDQLLINYAAQAPNTGLSFHGGNSQYTAGGAAEAARTSLATTYSWTITDGGPAASALAGGGGISSVNTNPNTISALDTQDVRYDAMAAYDHANQKFYVYDSSEVGGSRWKELLRTSLDSLRTDIDEFWNYQLVVAQSP